jgi:hypothetical protein
MMGGAESGLRSSRKWSVLGGCCVCEMGTGTVTDSPR